MPARRFLAAIAVAVLPAVVGTAADARPDGTAALPSPSAASSIVKSLLDRRELALSAFQADPLPAVETGSALRQDTSYLASVHCGCERPKDDYHAFAVVPQIPKSSVQPVFFAQVHTVDNDTGARSWDIVAVTHTGSAGWKIAFVAAAGSQASPPLQSLTKSTATTPGVTGAAETRMARLARNDIAAVMAHATLVAHTDYGATDRARFAVAPEKDGIFGLVLPSGDVLSCFTAHGYETYTMPSGGLQQDAAQSHWGHQLAPGVYASITFDEAEQRCDVGSGTDAAAGKTLFRSDLRTVGTTGVPL